MRILIVEDDEYVAKALTIILSNQHHTIEVAADGQAGWELIEAFVYDLILLDVVLPKFDGISLCRRLRSQGCQVPILLLTGRDSSQDKVMGLDAGADDYVVKPFNQEELIARVRALLRRGSSTSPPVLEWGRLRLDPSTREVVHEMCPLQLTPKEYSLLELFLRNSRQVFSCSAILDHLWSFEKTPGEEAVRTQIKGLRQKLKAAGASTDLIETVYGFGYRLKPLEATISLAAASETNRSQTRQVLAAVADVWDRLKTKICQQIGVLEQAVAALVQETLSQELRQQAEESAHTLAGSLGVFGFTKGSQLARKIEHLFEAVESLGQNETMHLCELVSALHQEMEQTIEGLNLKPITNKGRDEHSLPLV